MRIVVAAFVLIAACQSGTSSPLTEVTGTWGGDDAGLIATDTTAHIHIGCTLGDTNSPIHPALDGSFTSDGTYNVDAFPIDRGIVHSARFTGRVDGNTMKLTVTLLDNGVQVGPVTLTRGKEPKMGPCPICRKPGERRSPSA
jgi:hypothetical protein